MIEMLKLLAASALRVVANRLDPPVQLQPVALAEFELADRIPRRPAQAAVVEPKRGSIAWRLAQMRGRGVLH